jgi:hypothetical protein
MLNLSKECLSSHEAQWAGDAMQLVSLMGNYSSRLETYYVKSDKKPTLNYVIWYALTVVLLSGAGSHTLMRDIHHELLIRPHYSVRAVTMATPQ